jgi:hypothetical protein
MTEITETTEPSRAESRASFRVLGTNLNLDEVTRALGTNPTRVHSPGDVDILGKPFPHFMWLLESPLRTNQDLAAHLDWLGATLSPRLSYLRVLKSSADLSIVCNFRTYDTDQGGFTLRSENLSLPLELDVRMEFHLLFI